MSKQELINIVGKMFVDEQFRTNYLNATNIDQLLNNVQGLDDTDKQFLKDEKETIQTAIKSLDTECPPWKSH
jgi:hypothetical protein